GRMGDGTLLSEAARTPRRWKRIAPGSCRPSRLSVRESGRGGVHVVIKLLPALLAIVALPAGAQGDGARPLKVVSRSKVFVHKESDPQNPLNWNGFNAAPSVVCLPDGALLVVWYSSPYEGSPRQVILASRSSDSAATWSVPEVIQDFPGKPDFDP